MDDTLQFILSLSVVFAVIIGIVRFREIDASYYPFLYCLALSLVTEIIIRILSGAGNWNGSVIVVNVFSLVEFCLFTWLFHNWGLFSHRKSTFLSVLGAFFIAWLVINISINHFIRGGFYFFILYSFALIFFSVTTFNKLIVNERKSIFRNPKFWICLGIVIFYSFFSVRATTRVSFVVGGLSETFWKKWYEINVYSNLLVNLLYAVAVIWIPRKKKFTTRF